MIYLAGQPKPQTRPIHTYNQTQLKLPKTRPKPNIITHTQTPIYTKTNPKPNPARSGLITCDPRAISRGQRAWLQSTGRPRPENLSLSISISLLNQNTPFRARCDRFESLYNILGAQGLIRSFLRGL